MENTNNIINLLKKNEGEFGRIISLDYNNLPFSILDLSSKNKDLKNIDISNPKEFEIYLKETYKKENSIFGIGQYNEDRCIYDHSDLFDSEEKRTLHLGIDLWTDSGVDVLCPYDSKVHSFQNNVGNGDYGPTIILEHEIENTKFHTLYGHLSISSLEGLIEGKTFLKGEKIAEIGNFPENGNWGPHVHFEIIADLLGKKGDFPGVAKTSESEKYLSLCPNPNLILNISGLEENKNEYKR